MSTVIVKIDTVYQTHSHLHRHRHEQVDHFHRPAAIFELPFNAWAGWSITPSDCRSQQCDTDWSVSGVTFIQAHKIKIYPWLVFPHYDLGGATTTKNPRWMSVIQILLSWKKQICVQPFWAKYRVWSGTRAVLNERADALAVVMYKMCTHTGYFCMGLLAVLWSSFCCSNLTPWKVISPQVVSTSWVKFCVTISSHTDHGSPAQPILLYIFLGNSLCFTVLAGWAPALA